MQAKRIRMPQISTATASDTFEDFLLICCARDSIRLNIE